jgi:hypothetical protein
MKIDSNDQGDIIVTFTEDEAREIAQDEMFDDEKTYAATSRLRDVLQHHLDEMDDDIMGYDDELDEDDIDIANPEDDDV